MVRARVFGVRLVHVPNAVIVREGIVAAHGLSALIRAPAHHELSAVRH